MYKELDNMGIDQEIDIQHELKLYENMNLEKPRIKRRKQKYKTKKKLQKLKNINWWAVEDKGYLKRNYISDRKAYAKKQSNSKVRRTKHISNGKNYRKVYDLCWEVL